MRVHASFHSTIPECESYVDDEVEKCYHETEAHVKHFKVRYKWLMSEVLRIVRSVREWSLTREFQEKEKEEKKPRPLFTSPVMKSDGDVYNIVDLILDFCRWEVDLMETWGPIARTVENSLARKFWTQAQRSRAQAPPRLFKSFFSEDAAENDRQHLMSMII